MEKNRLIQIVGIVVFLIIASAVSSAMGLLSLPKGVQSVYYGVLFNATSPEDNPDSLTALHTATKAKHINAKGEAIYTYKYSQDDRPIIIRDSAKCEACHGSMLDKYPDGKPKHRIHTKMLTAPMLGFSCTDCHKKVDITKRSPAKPTFRVDRTLCPKCHDPSSPAPPAETTGGITWGYPNAPDIISNVFKKHGADYKSGKRWLRAHPRIAMAVGIDKCRKCHQYGSELDFCRKCHLRGGFRPSHHRAVYNVPVNELYPEKTDRTQVIQTKWRGYHFYFVRKALEKLGTKLDNPRKLPYEQLQKLTCSACHVIKDWCTRCHVKHAPGWLTKDGHPKRIKQFGRNYCYRCHDTLGGKCQACHPYKGNLYEGLPGKAIPENSQN